MMIKQVFEETENMGKDQLMSTVDVLEVNLRKKLELFENDINTLSYTSFCNMN